MTTQLTDHTTAAPVTSTQPAGTDPAAPPRRALRSRIGVAETLRQSLTVAWRNVMQIRHTPEKLLDVILMPAVFLVLFLYVFGGAVAGSTHAYLEVLLPGLVAMMAMFATMSLGTSLCDDIRKGVFDRFRSLPIARSAPLIGSVLGDTVRFCALMAVLTGFGCALGFRFHAAPLDILAAYGLAYLFYLAVCWISVLIGLSVSSPETVQGVSFIWTMPLTFGSSVLLASAATMPGWLQAWARVNPVTDLADSVRALMLGGPVGLHPLYTLIWAAGIVLVTFPLAMRMYARRV
jgi:oleandomycin transport system permease protein